MSPKVCSGLCSLHCHKKKKRAQLKRTASPIQIPRPSGDDRTRRSKMFINSCADPPHIILKRQSADSFLNDPPSKSSELRESLRKKSGGDESEDAITGPVDDGGEDAITGPVDDGDESEGQTGTGGGTAPDDDIYEDLQNLRQEIKTLRQEMKDQQENHLKEMKAQQDNHLKEMKAQQDNHLKEVNKLQEEITSLQQVIAYLQPFAEKYLQEHPDKASVVVDLS